MSRIATSAFRPQPLLTVALLAAAALGGACKRKTEATKPAAAAAASTSAPAAAKPAVDAVTGRVADAVRKAANACNPDEKLTFVSACAEYKALPNLIAAEAKTGAAKVLDDLGALAAAGDEKALRIVGFLAGEGAVASLVGEVLRAKGTVSAAAAAGLVKGLGLVKGAFAIRLAGLATDAAGVTQQLAALRAVIANHPDGGVAPAVLRVVMRHGRLGALAMIEDALKPGQRTEWRQAASAAPMNMYQWTQPEKDKVCPLGKVMLADADLEVAANGAHVLARCKGAYVDDLLAEGKKRVLAGQWKKPFLWAYRDICFKGFFGNEAIPGEDVCQKVYDFLASVAKSEKVGAWERGFALDMIYYQRRDQKTYDFLKKWAKHKVPEIAKAAKDAMTSLEKSYLKKK